MCVETDEMDDVSELFPLWLPMILGAVECDLFLWGSGGRTLPGNSVRNLLCKRAKSPYRRPTKCSCAFFLLTRRRNSFTL